MKTFVDSNQRQINMFRKNRCPKCGRKLNADWNFCPYCGYEVKPKIISPLEGIFEDVEKEFEKLDKMFGIGFKIPKIPLEKGGGVSITIHSGTGMKPKIEVKTSGEYKKIEPELKRKLGIKPAIEEVEEKPARRKMPKITEEPETKVKIVGNKRIISLILPGVKDSKDIEIKRLEQSVEIKAFAKDRAYFKLIPVPSDVSIRSEFKDGILTLEIER